MANQFIIKNTMADMRSITASEIKDIRDGVFDGYHYLAIIKKEIPLPRLYIF